MTSLWAKMIRFIAKSDNCKIQNKTKIQLLKAIKPMIAIYI